MVQDMLLKDIKNILGDKVVIYREVVIEARSETFENLYIGDVENIPVDVLLMTIRIIGAKRKGVLDIWVK